MSFHLLQVPHSFGLKLYVILYCFISPLPPVWFFFFFLATCLMAESSCFCLIQLNFLRSPQRHGIRINCGPVRCHSSLCLKPSLDFRRQKWKERGQNWGEYVWIWGKRLVEKNIVTTSYLQCPRVSVLFILGAQSIAVVGRERGAALYFLLKTPVLMIRMFCAFRLGVVPACERWCGRWMEKQHIPPKCGRRRVCLGHLRALRRCSFWTLVPTVCTDLTSPELQLV